MNKVQYKASPKAIVEAEGESVLVAFERVAELATIFAHADKCGCCQSTEIIPQVRRPQSYVYYEFRCLKCSAQLTFNQHKKEQGGGLYLKMTDENNNPRPNGCWSIYQGRDQGYAAPPVGRQPQGRQQQPAQSQYGNSDSDIPY